MSTLSGAKGPPGRPSGTPSTLLGARGSGRPRAGGSELDRAAAAGEAGLLRSLEVDHALAVVGDGSDLVDLGQGQVALGLGHEEVRGHAGRELLLLGVQALGGQLSRGAG